MPEPLPNGKIVSAFGYSAVFTLSPEAVVDEVQVDFLSSAQLSQDQLHQRLNEVVGEYVKNGAELLAYLIWEEIIFDFTIPEEFCLGPFDIGGITFGPWCWSPPGAGQTLAAAYRYRFYLLSRDRVAAYARPGVMPLTFLAAAGIALIILTVTGSVIFVYAFLTNRITFDDVREFLRDFLRAPGENIESALGGLTGPLMAMAITMVAAGIFLPMAATRFAVSQPTPTGGRVEAEISGGSAQPRRRR